MASVEPAVVLLVTIVASLSFAPFYGSHGWLPALAGAALLGVVVAALSTSLRLRWWLVGPAAVVLFVLYAVAVGYREQAVYGLPGPAALRALGAGLTSGWARMLTVALPGDVDGDLLVTPMLMVFLAAVAGTVLALRTSHVTLLALPPLLVDVAGLLVTASRPADRLVQTGGFLLALLVLLLLRSNRVSAASSEGIAERDAVAIGLDLTAQRRTSTLGRMVFGLPMVAVVTALGTGAAWVLPIADGSDRFDPRAFHERRFQLSTALTPLALIKPQLETNPPAKLFTVTMTQHGGTASVDRVRVAALDSFDGALWTRSRDFVIAGSTLPEGPPLKPPVVTVDLDVNVTRLLDPFLPAIGRPVRVAADDVAFDPSSGTLVSTRPAVSGYRYHVTSHVRPIDDSLAKALISQTPADRAYTQLPNPPAWLRAEAERIVRGYPTPATQLLAIEAYLKSFGYAVSARPGHSYGAIQRVLLGRAENEAGYAEQFASAFALLARAIGYPARVAVGYRLMPEKRQGDAYQVDTSDAHAWPEVHLAGFGWVAFEPTNTKNPATAAPPREQTAPVLPADERVQQPLQPQAEAVPGAAPATGGGTGAAVRRTAFAVGAVSLAVLGLLLAAAGAKALRRMARAKRGPPSARIAAAWRETADRMRERGLRAPPALTPAEVAAASAATGPGARAAAQVAELALVTTSAVCAPDEPPEEAARRSWQLEAEIRRAVGRGTPVSVRVRAFVDPRPLLPRRRRRIRLSARPNRRRPDVVNTGGRR
jgi:transglutaminase-like putative cysteine protease